MATPEFCSIDGGCRDLEGVRTSFRTRTLSTSSAGLMLLLKVTS